jgi:F0F1-type ATP synthase assembly protein I
VSQPPEYPGRQRFKRVAAAAGSEAYQGAFEAIGSVLIACAFGYWVDSRWDTRPFGMLIGVVIGFAAMVLRLVRLGKEIHPDSVGAESSNSSETTTRVEDDLGVGEAPGMSSALRDDNGISDNGVSNDGVSNDGVSDDGVSHDRASEDDENGRVE